VTRTSLGYSLTRRLSTGATAIAALLVIMGVTASGALAGTPRWNLGSRSAPSYLRPGQEGRIIAVVGELGDGSVNADNKLVTITDTLPPELTVSANALERVIGGLEGQLWVHSSGTQIELECKVAEPARKVVTCTSTAQLLPITPYHRLEVEIPVEVGANASSVEENQVSVSGGEAVAEGGHPQPEAPQPEVLNSPITVKNEQTPFGIEGGGGYGLLPENEDGSADTQAGSHPFQLTTTLNLNQVLESTDHQPGAPALPRNLDFNLPPGLLGDPQAVAKCSDVEFSTIIDSNANLCPASTAVGAATVSLNLPVGGGRTIETVPVFNLVPASGEPARFGLEAAGVPVILDTAVRTDGDYGVSVGVNNTTELPQLLGSQVTLWGEPYDRSHDASRGWSCLRSDQENGETCEMANEFARPVAAAAFLTAPTACTGTLKTFVEGESWPVLAPGESPPGKALLLEGPPFTEYELAPDGFQECGDVPFEPSLSAYPVDQREAAQAPKEAEEEREGHGPDAALGAASTPTGLNFRIKLPAEGPALGEPGVLLGESAVKQTDVTLPAGVQLSPSGANGLQACSESEIGFEGEGSAEDPYAPGVHEPLRFSSAETHCPEASKVATVRIKSPDLEDVLQGGVYVAESAPNGESGKNPFDSLFAIYIVAEDPPTCGQPGQPQCSGVRVKLAGKVSLDQQTGQITSSFENTPQVPFEELKLHFFEGPHASLSTPALCGSYATTTRFTGWSGAVREPQSEAPFTIDSGPGGAPCPTDPLPFEPSFQAGSTNNQAGAFTPFSLTIGNPGGDRPLTGVAIQLPEGIAALLSKVTPCPEPPIGQEWSCGAESLIGHSIASAGLGSEPYELPGQVFLTSGYDGAPFGLLVQTRAKAGPFELGMVNVRSRINVNPSTAAVTITTDPGPRGEALPTRLRGVPAQIRQINVTVDRPEFEFNPTNCEQLHIEGTLTGPEGASASVSSPFRVTNCASLAFSPKFTASVAGKGSKADGTSLTVKLESGALGSGGLSQANVAKVDLQLPRALPSRLSTLQRACPDAVFDADPASCDPESDIGHATVDTPVLKSPLSGPAYLVSHGGAEFPDLEFVLQGEGIALVLDGKTDIKAGITYSKFESAPDAPFSSFETVLPAGPYSVLTPAVAEKEDFSLCKTSLAMPTELTGQNGTVIRETTSVAVTGCGGVASYKETNAQRLAKALKTCKKDRKKRKRVACEKAARKKYGAKLARRPKKKHKK
jgi:hypothetical protein